MAVFTETGCIPTSIMSFSPESGFNSIRLVNSMDVIKSIPQYAPRFFGLYVLVWNIGFNIFQYVQINTPVKHYKVTVDTVLYSTRVNVQ